MKAALCLYGYFDCLTDTTSKGMDGYEHIKKNILNKVDTDVFIHSWQPELKDFLENLYEPKLIKSEPQIDFLLRPFANQIKPLGNKTVLTKFHQKQNKLQLLTNLKNIK